MPGVTGEAKNVWFLQKYFMLNLGYGELVAGDEYFLG